MQGNNAGRSQDSLAQPAHSNRIKSVPTTNCTRCSGISVSSGPNSKDQHQQQGERQTSADKSWAPAPCQSDRQDDGEGFDHFDTEARKAGHRGKNSREAGHGIGSSAVSVRAATTVPVRRRPCREQSPGAANRPPRPNVGRIMDAQIKSCQSDEYGQEHRHAQIKHLEAQAAALAAPARCPASGRSPRKELRDH